MPGSRSLPHVIIFLLFWFILWYVKDTIAAIGLLMLLYQWLYEENMQHKLDYNQVPHRLRRLLSSDYSQSSGATNYNHDIPEEKRSASRPYLYESRVVERRGRSESNKSLASEFLTPDTEEPESFDAETLRNLLSSEGRKRHSVAAPSAPSEKIMRPRSERKVQSARSRHQNETIPGDEDRYPPLTSSEMDKFYSYDNFEDEEGLIDFIDDTDDVYDLDDVDEDEFFLATDFADPLPKSDHSQSVSYLDSIVVVERSFRREEDERRTRSAYDIRELSSMEQYGTLEKDLSTTTDSSDENVESLPPESLEGSQADDLCPSPPLSDEESLMSSYRLAESRSQVDTIQSAREPRSYHARVTPPRLSRRSTSEPHLLNRTKSRSSTLLAEEVDLDGIQNHSEFRQKLRAMLGLHQNSEQAINDTSLEFRTPHRKTTEQLHNRLRRVLSSVGNSEEDLLHDENITTSKHRHSRKGRTKSVPVDAKEFFDQINNNANEERSKSVEYLNHQDSMSAFRLYDDPFSSREGLDSVQFDSKIDIDEYERFIDSPQMVDYQLGRRNKPPSDSSLPPEQPEEELLTGMISAETPPPGFSSVSNSSESEDEEVKAVLEVNQDLGGASDRRETEYRCVHATPVILTTPITVRSRAGIHHATPILLSTPNSEGERHETKLSVAGRGWPADSDFEGLRTETVVSPIDLGSSEKTNLLNQKSETTQMGVSAEEIAEVMGPKKKISTSTTSKRVNNHLKASVPFSNKHTSTRGTASSPHDTLAETSNRKGTGYFLQFSSPTVSQSQLQSPRKRQSAKPPGNASQRKSRIPVKKSGDTTEDASRPIEISGTRTRSVSPKILKKDERKVEESLIQAAEICSQLQVEPTIRVDNSDGILDSHSSYNTYSNNKTTDAHCSFDTSVSNEPIQQKESTIDFNSSVDKCDTSPPSIAQECAMLTQHTINTIDNSFIDQNTSNIDKTRLSSEYKLSESECDSVKDSHRTEAQLNTSELDTPDYTPPGSTIHEDDDSHTLDTSELTINSTAEHNTYHIHGCQELDLTDEEEANVATLDETERDSSVLGVNERSTIAHSCEEVQESVTSTSSTLQQLEKPDSHKEFSSNHLEGKDQPEAQARRTMASSWMDRLKEDLDNDEEWLSDEEAEFQREQEEKMRAAQKRTQVTGHSSSDEEDFSPPPSSYQRSGGVRPQQQRQQFSSSSSPSSSDQEDDEHHHITISQKSSNLNLRSANQSLHTQGQQQTLGNLSPRQVSPRGNLIPSTHSPRDMSSHSPGYKPNESEEEEMAYPPQRNAPNRRTMGRNSAEYGSSSDSDDSQNYNQMRGGEPGRDEMDMLVKKNLMYVNAKDLDQMDILSTDVDHPSSSLRVENGVGQILTDSDPGAMYSQGILRSESFDAKEDEDFSVGPDYEITGSLHVEEDERIEIERRDLEELEKWSATLQQRSSSNDNKLTKDHKHTDSSSDSRSSSDEETNQVKLAKEQAKKTLASDLQQELHNKSASDSEEEQPTQPLRGLSAREEVVVAAEIPQQAEYPPEPAIQRRQFPKNIETIGAHELDEDLKRDRLHYKRSLSAPSPDSMDFRSAGAIRSNTKRMWMLQLTQQMNEWEDELSQPSAQATGEAGEEEMVTSFVGDDDVKPSEKPNRKSDTEIREKVEGNMSDKIRDWRNMTAESVTGRVEEWQSLGKFNINVSPASGSGGKRHSIDDTVDQGPPVEKRRETTVTTSILKIHHKTSERVTVSQQPSSRQAALSKYEPDEEDDIRDSDEGDGYLSDSSSQDTVRERATPTSTITKDTKPRTDSVTSDDGSCANDQITRRPSKDGGYVQILGGEEPPDEWSNIEAQHGRQRERSASTSSSSSDGSGFQYISNKGPQLPQQAVASPAPNTQYAPVKPKRAAEQMDEVKSPSPASQPDILPQSEGWLHLEPQSSEKPHQTHHFQQIHHEPDQEEDLDHSDAEDSEILSSNKIPHQQPILLASRELSSPDHDVSDKDEQNTQRKMSASSSASSKSFSDEENPANKLDVPQTKVTSSSTSSSSSSSSGDSDDDKRPSLSRSSTTEAPPISQRKDSFDRVEKLREEMRTAGRSHTVDSGSVARPSRSTDRFAERMKYLEEQKSQRDSNRTRTPPALAGKFSAAFARFESPSDKNRSGSPLARKQAEPKPNDSVVNNKPVNSDKVKPSEPVYKRDNLPTKNHVNEDLLKPDVAKAAESLPIREKPATEELPKTRIPLETKSQDTAKPKETEKPETQISSESKPDDHRLQRPNLRRDEAVEKQPNEAHRPEEPKVATTPVKKHIEKTRSLDTAVPSRMSPSSRLQERLAKFGQSVDVTPQPVKEEKTTHFNASKLNTPSTDYNKPPDYKPEEKPYQTVTTKNELDRFERFTHSTAKIAHQTPTGSQSKAQPHFDVDIRVGHNDDQPVEMPSSNNRGKSRDEEQPKKDSRIASEHKEEYMNVWDTEVPVKDSREKVLMPTKLHVTTVSREITPSYNTRKASEPGNSLVDPSSPLQKAAVSPAKSRSKSLPRERFNSLPEQEFHVTIRPQITPVSSKSPTKQPLHRTSSPPRQRSSLALNPQDEITPIIAVKQQSHPDSSRYYNNIQPASQKPRSTSPERRTRSPERDHPLNRADSLDELRHGNIVSQSRNVFSRQDSNTDRYLPHTAHSKAYATRKPEPFGKTQANSYQEVPTQRQQNIKSAVRDLLDSYDQTDHHTVEDSLPDTTSRHEYIGYSRESLEYTRKWVENNETPQQQMYPKVQRALSEPNDDGKTPDPVKDDVALRRIQQANRSLAPKQYALPSYIGLTASPEPSVTSERGRGRSAEPERRVGRPKRRARSLPRKAPSRAIAEMASLFQSAEEPIRPSNSNQQQSSHYGRRSESPKHVTQKEKMSARKSMPAPSPHYQHSSRDRAHSEPDQVSPRASTKGVAMIVELYNKNKGDSPLPDLDEQTIGSVDEEMFYSRGQNPLSPHKGVEDAPLSAQAWKTWRSGSEKAPLEQKVERTYNKQTQQAQTQPRRMAPSNIQINSGWGQVKEHEEPAIRTINNNKMVESSPPRPAKSEQARLAMQRRAMSDSPPPAVPQRGYESDNDYKNSALGNGYPVASALDAYKQQTLQRFRQEEKDQYASIQRMGGSRQPQPFNVEQPVRPSHANAFDQALLIQAPPPKPERLYNSAEPWEAHQPQEPPPRTDSLHRTQPPTQTNHQPQYSSDQGYGAPARPAYPTENGYHQSRGHQPQHSGDYNNRDYTPQTQYPTNQENRYQQQQGYPQGYRGGNSYNNYPSTQQPAQPQYRDARPPRESYGPADHSRYQQQRPQEFRYPHEMEPRGPIPDPRYTHQAGDRVDSSRYPVDPYVQQPTSDPRYPAYQQQQPAETQHMSSRPPRRTNSVPNIKQQLSPTRLAQQHQQLAAPQQISYDPRYHDQYVQHRAQQGGDYRQHGSLPRDVKQNQRGRNEQSNLPEFIPIQYATGKYPPRPASVQPDYNNQKHINNNYPYTNRNAYPPHGPNGGYSNGHSYPSQQASQQRQQGYPSQNPSQYPSINHDPYFQQPARPRPGVGVIYNPDLGISDF